MVSQTTILKAVKNLCGILLVIGVSTFLAGVFGNASSAWTGIGIGTVMGAVFIFLMGIFFTATQEMLDKTEKPSSISIAQNDNVIPFIKK